MRRIMLPLLALASLLALSPAVALAHDGQGLAAGDARAADCESIKSVRAAREADLASAADRVERNVAMPDGSRVDRYVFGLAAVAGPAPDGGQIILAHNGGDHASGEANSPFNVNGYRYSDYASILHWISDPCSGPDYYAFDFASTCFGESSIPVNCNWDVQATLKTSQLDGPWLVGPWGWAQYRLSGDPVCAGTGGRHAIGDNIGTRIRTEVRVTARFPDGLLSQARRHTSKHMNAIDSHPTQIGSCTYQFCDGGQRPSTGPDRTCS